MIIILSPSKTVDFETPAPTKKSTTPHFIKNADILAKEMKKFSSKELAQMMKISENLANLNYDRFQNFEKLPQKQAIFAFNGDVYRDIDAENYNEKEMKFAQKHLRTISGLYGMLKPLDLIRAYRLEMHHRSDYWKKLLPEHIKNEDLIINLASNEYSKPLNLKSPKTNVLTPHFKTHKNGELKTIAIYSKIARGTMANFIIKNQITDPAKLEQFSEDGWKFHSKTENEITFAR